ncbi:MAG TPA: hypothetical protein P5293_05685 [Bacteroidales bacterium]|nr:hypothetical protein [Bacteroidales bacterium]
MMNELIQRIQRTRDIIYRNGDLPCMAIVHNLQNYSTILKEMGLNFEAAAVLSAGSLLYNFPVYKFDQIYPDSIRYGAVILLDRVIDNLTERM